MGKHLTHGDFPLGWLVVIVSGGFFVRVFVFEAY